MVQASVTHCPRRMTLLTIILLCLFLANSCTVIDGFHTFAVTLPKQTHSKSVLSYINDDSYQHQSDVVHDDSAFSSLPSKTMTTSKSADTIRRIWMDQSIRYYSKVMREERRRSLGQTSSSSSLSKHPSSSTTTTTLQPKESIEQALLHHFDPSSLSEFKDDHDQVVYNKEYVQLAKKHYFALRKIKDGKPHHAESIYRRIIQELLREDEIQQQQVGQHKCDNAKLAITTLLLALHMQRSGDIKATRSVFLHFFRKIVIQQQQQQQHHDHEEGHQCACSAKVLQAYALFEMKHGNKFKSLDIIYLAIQYDPTTIQPILNWKQFRDVQERRHHRLNSNSSQQQ